MQFDHLSSIQVVMLKVATGRPLVYELDDNLNSIDHYYADRPLTGDNMLSAEQRIATAPAT